MQGDTTLRSTHASLGPLCAPRDRERPRRGALVRVHARTVPQRAQHAWLRARQQRPRPPCGWRRRRLRLGHSPLYTHDFARDGGCARFQAHAVATHLCVLLGDVEHARAQEVGGDDAHRRLDRRPRCERVHCERTHVVHTVLGGRGAREGTRGAVEVARVAGGRAPWLAAASASPMQSSMRGSCAAASCAAMPELAAASSATPSSAALTCGAAASLRLAACISAAAFPSRRRTCASPSRSEQAFARPRFILRRSSASRLRSPGMLCDQGEELTWSRGRGESVLNGYM